MSSKQFREGSEVEWNWGNGTGKGVVIERFTEHVKKSLDGTEVTRDASEEEPAYLIEQDDGSQVLKSKSELSRP